MRRNRSSKNVLNPFDLCFWGDVQAALFTITIAIDAGQVKE